MKKIFLIVLSFFAISSISLAFGLNADVNYQDENVISNTGVSHSSTATVTVTGDDDLVDELNILDDELIKITQKEKEREKKKQRDYKNKYRMPENCQV